MPPPDHAQQRAQSHADSLHRELLAHPDAVPSGVARALALVLAVLVIASTAALVPFAAWLGVALPNRVMGVLAAALVLGVVWTIRPRAARLPDDAVLVQPGPHLSGLLAEVARAVGTAPPRTVAVIPDINAAVYDGSRRDGRVLLLGAPYWLALAPQARVALLGHELGHFASHDTRRNGVVKAAFDVLHGWRALLDDGAGAHGGVERYEQYGGVDGSGGGFIAMTASAITRVVLWVVGFVPLALGWALIHLTSRDAQRSEYRADRTAAAVGGRDAALAWMALNQREAALDAALQRAALGRTSTLDAARAFDATTEPPMAAPGRHDRADPFDSHPPTPYRIEALAALAGTSAAVVLDSARAGAVDAELEPAFARIERRVRDAYLG